MRLILPLLFSLCLFSQQLKSQLTGSGSISNYAIFCIGGSNCIDNSSIEITHPFTAPDDGTMVVTVNLMPEIVMCCDNSYPQTVVGLLLNKTKLFTIASFTTLTPMTFEYKCVQKDDEFNLVFGGTKGSYNYTVTMTPPSTSNDSEPNNTFDKAVVVAPNVMQEGHIGFGKYMNKDFRDWFRLDIPQNGELQLNATFDGPLNIYIRKYTNGRAQIVNSFHPNPGQTELKVPCLADVDSVLVEIESRTNFCAGYSFSYKVNATGGTNDVEPNNEEVEADLIKNFPGSISGNIGHGVTVKDYSDYFILGELLANDSLHFSVTTGGPQISIRIFRGLFTFPFKDFLNVPSGGQGDFTVVTPGDYVIRITGSNCTWYSVDITGRISNQRIDGVDALQAANALGSLGVSNSTAGPGSATLCAPCVTFCPVFEVPDGVELTVITKQN